jgi:SNF2 family DNA or RNA helicase
MPWVPYPPGTDVTDLHGQLKFLGAYPAMIKSVFDNWFKDPLSRAHRRGGNRTTTLALTFLSSFMIRHTKNQRLGGRKILELPPKTESTVEVTLGPQVRRAKDLGYRIQGLGDPGFRV